MKNRIYYKMLRAFGLSQVTTPSNTTWRGHVLGRRVTSRQWFDPVTEQDMIELYIDYKEVFKFNDRPSQRLRAIRHICMIVRHHSCPVTT
jgi:hypothetical protein